MTSEAPVQTAPTGASGLDEGEYVTAAHASDEDAVRELIRRLNPRPFRIARGIVDSDADAEDVVQETYLAAFTRLDRPGVP